MCEGLEKRKNMINLGELIEVLLLPKSQPPALSEGFGVICAVVICAVGVHRDLQDERFGCGMGGHLKSL